ncbi:MAG: hypothetical protein H2049_12545 [Porphyrobacter sp.]|nr:hypothetical protein [Porphyrobacter sp.]
MTEKTLFRALPGIADFELRYSNTDRLMKDELDDLWRDGDRISLALFGITISETDYYSAVEAGFKGSVFDWQSYFEFLDREELEADEDAFWEAVGLDFSDDEGEQLACVGYFGRQTICAVRGFLPAASLRFRSNSVRTDKQIEAEAEAWGRMLLSGRQA